MSLNAIKTGLYTAQDFVREGEHEEYTQTLTALIDELDPEGILQQTFAAEIMGATWRLRRCRMIEATFASSTLDPMVDEETEKQQKSVDRARAQSHNILRRSLAELRKLQAERGERESEPEVQPAKPFVPKRGPVTDEMLDELEAYINEPTPFCIPPAQTPRNAQCPCNSGAKYKRCCGQGAPPVLNIAA